MTVAAPVSAAARADAEAVPVVPSSRRALAFADFHTHTRFSRDSILPEDKFIRVALERGLTHVAVTNHNNVEGAVAVRDRAAELGVDDRLTVILGEEVSTSDGEVVGLFLERTIPRGLTADETADQIHAQGGLVSIPHPFDPFRASHIRRLPLERLAAAGKIDMLEVFNSRVTFSRHNDEAAEFAARHQIPGIACSDSHSAFEVAMSFNALPAFTTADELRDGLAENEWHGTRSTVLIHLTTRFAVWTNIVRRWLGHDTATAPVLGPEPPRQVEKQPVEAPAASELPKLGEPEASDDRG
ncbi:MAG: PHP domain-containing protein [Chloroflexota bacterium]